MQLAHEISRHVLGDRSLVSVTLDTRGSTQQQSRADNIKPYARRHPQAIGTSLASVQDKRRPRPPESCQSRLAARVAGGQSLWYARRHLSSSCERIVGPCMCIVTKATIFVSTLRLTEAHQSTAPSFNLLTIIMRGTTFIATALVAGSASAAIHKVRRALTTGIGRH